MIINSISRNILHKLLRYDPETGKLFWRKSPVYHVQDGDEAGYVWRGERSKSAYRYIKINSRNYQAQNIIWVMLNGPITDGFEVDHIDHDGLNNCYNNLRLVTIIKNHHNKPKRKDNTSGHTGVCWNKVAGKWYSDITVKGKRESLGYFKDFSDAVAIREAAEIRYGFHKNHGR